MRDEPGWGQIVQLLLRAMDTSSRNENFAQLAERMADGVQCLYGSAREKPHPYNDAIKKDASNAR